MPIPTARTIVHEILQQIADGQEHDLNSLRRHIVQTFQITREEENERLPSGRESVLANRIRNATFVLRKEYLALFPDAKNVVQITDKGKKYLVANPRNVTTYTTTIPRPDK